MIFHDLRSVFGMKYFFMMLAVTVFLVGCEKTEEEKRQEQLDAAREKIKEDTDKIFDWMEEKIEK